MSSLGGKLFDGGVKWRDKKESPAAIVMAIGLTLIAGAAMFKLDLVETVALRDLALALGGALVVLGIFSIASYCVVRAIEWANRR